MPVIQKNGLVIDLIDEGSGAPVLLAHSSVSGNRQWKKMIELLCGRYRVLAPNLHGYGQTTAWTEDGAMTLDDAAKVLLAVCEGLDGPIRMVGHSWGGSAALAAAAQLGTRVSHLALFEPMNIAMLRDHGIADAWAEGSALYTDVKRLGGAGDWMALAKRFTDYFNGDGAWDATPPERQKAVAGLLLPNYYEWDASKKPCRAEDFAGIRARTLLTRSADTRLVLRAVSDLLRRTYPAWQFHEFPDGGHMAPLTRADAFNQRVAAFLDLP